MDQIKKYILPGDKRIPMILESRIKMYYLFSIGVLLLGALFTIGLNEIRLLVLFVSVSVILFLLGYSTKLKLSKRGVDIIDGTCIQVDMGKVSNIRWDATVLPKRTPRRFLIQENRDKIIYSIPYMSSFANMVEGGKYRIYVDVDSLYYNLNGVTNITRILGYEIIG